MSNLSPVGDMAALSRRMLCRTMASLDKPSQQLAYIQAVVRGLKKPLRWMLKDHPLTDVDALFEVSSYTPLYLNPRCFIASALGQTPASSEGTLLGLAACGNQLEVLAVLLKAGAKPSLWADEGVLHPASPLLESLRMQAPSQSWSILWKAIPSSERVRYQQGHAALQLIYQAVRRATPEMVKVLLNEGIAPLDNTKLCTLLEQKWPEVLTEYSRRTLSKTTPLALPQTVFKTRI